MKRRIAVWNSPRPGGPLRWSKDLVAHINDHSPYQARLVTQPGQLFVGHVWPQADLIHAAIPVTARLWHLPYILTVKGDYTIEKDFWKFLYPQAIRSADVVTVPSQYLVDRIPALKNAMVIPNAVNLEQFVVATPPPAESVNLLVVSNFWFPEKARGVEHLLKLVQTATHHMSSQKVKTTVVGDGAYLEKIKKVAHELGIDVHFPGWSDPRVFFKDANLFLYYSYHDNMPNAVLEAMAAGLPVITNQVGAIQEMIISGRDGLIVHSDDEYVESLTALIQEPDRRKQIGQNARLRIEQDFSWTRVIKRYLELYQKLLI